MKQRRRSSGVRLILGRVVLAGAVVSTLTCRSARPPADTEERAGQALVTSGLIAKGSSWRYFDDGTQPPSDAQGDSWHQPAFDDSAWPAGPAKLGYDVSNSQTFGTRLTATPFGTSVRLVTAYFRRTFDIGPAELAALKAVRLDVLRDDGVIIYVNGEEVARDRMPAAPAAIAYGTFAQSPAVSQGNFEENAFVTSFSPSMLVAGTNTIAVEVHQQAASSSDLSFDLQMTGYDEVVLARGPYIQLGTPSTPVPSGSRVSAVIRWRTIGPSSSRVRVGTDPNALDLTFDNATVTAEHEVPLLDLAPDTLYYYAIGDTGGTVLAGGDAGHAFRTFPPPGTEKPIRIWALGDSGTADAAAAAVRDAFVRVGGDRAPDVWLALGDNAYERGTDVEHQRAVFDTYPTFLRRAFYWPTIGNHETDQVVPGTGPGTFPYLDMFTLPTNGEAGGLASTTERYYSFDYGNIHFVCLDSMTSNRLRGGTMLNWLQADLADTDKKWVIAYWHHPPYTKGSHNSDTETELMQMRDNANRILENAGVDLVLTGHSHSYERSYLIDGHYGTSSTFNAPTMSKTYDAATPANKGTSGISGEGERYRKTTYGKAPHEGAVYVVTGSAGKVSSGQSANHAAMFVTLFQLGSLVVDVKGNRMDARFVRETGAIEDTFTIIKGDETNALPKVSITAPTAAATVAFGTPLSLSAQASDADGTVGSVTFFANGVAIGSAPVGVAGMANLSHIPLAPGPYRFHAETTDNAGALSISKPSAVVTVSPPPPGAIPSVTATPGIGQVVLSWSDVSQETGYRIERSPAGAGTFTLVGRVAANVLTFSDTGLAPGVVHDYRVRGTSGSGDSPWSAVVSAAALAGNPTMLVPFRAAWKYLDDNSDPGATWTAREFDDGAWTTGTAELGFGDGDESTVISGGPSTARYPTTYFRRTIHVPDPTSYPALTLSLRRDDGAVVYVNGVEVYRSNMGGGVIGRTTLAPGDATDDGNTVFAVGLPPSVLSVGANTIAVEVHQNNATSSDLTFDLALAAASSFAPPGEPFGLTAVVNSASQITLSWFDNSLVEQGFRVERAVGSGAFTVIADLSAEATSHVVTGLAGNVPYRFRVHAYNAAGPSPSSRTGTAQTSCGPEVCDGVDNDCAGGIDDMGSVSCGMGACARTVAVCASGATQTCTPGAPSAESCNAIDDDCDGVADNGLGQASCGVGACVRSVDACVAGVPQSCSPGAPSPEICNGVDDDCDGVADNGLGQVSCGVGACARTVAACDGGAAPICTPGTPSAETCNGIDDDCNGVVDEGLAPLSCGVGVCARTVSACVLGDPQVCRPGVPAPEACNGVDDDCDGTVDNGIGRVGCGTGACARTVEGCMAGEPLACVPGVPSPEACNGIDDDCNGAVDEGFGQVSCGVGACARTVEACAGGVAQTCAPGAPGTEACNGIDDDCDGTVDEDLPPVSCGVGACARTVSTCVLGDPQVCTPGASAPEACNGVDDDCDGTVDNGIGSLGCGVGACARTVQGCVAGEPQACVPGAPSPEACNGIDDDCNGAVDEGFGQVSCGVGACARTVEACVGGAAQTCAPGAPGSEVCNGIDDDCDGAVDEDSPAVSCGVGACARTVSACVLGDSQVCTPGAPTAETCNGVDDDCDTLVDDMGTKSCGIGACRRTVAVCAGGVLQTCKPGTPGVERCNGIDDDCDGRTDEGYRLGRSCSAGVGACRRTGVHVCSPDGLGTICSATPGTPTTEVCDDRDNDCDGRIDEGRVCR